jgi:hypothetical protein
VALFSYLYAYCPEWNSKSPAMRRAKSLPLARTGAQTVVDMNRREPVAEAGSEFVQDLQEYHRIDAARESRGNALTAQLQPREKRRASALRFP